MTNTITKITYDGNDYKVGEGYTAGTGISISASNEISNSGVTSVNGSTGAVTVAAEVQVSTQANNILSSGMKIWAGEETDYANLGSYSNDTLYLTIPDQS